MGITGTEMTKEAAEAKDERESAFSHDTFSTTFVTSTGLTFSLLVMSTVLGPFQGAATDRRKVVPAPRSP